MIDLTGIATPAPMRTAASAPFWDAAARREFLLQHCGHCGAWVFYPREICPQCWRPVLEWRPAGGTGRLATWSVVHRAAHPSWQPVTPYVIGIVRLDEGPSLLSHILAAEPALARDLPVRVAFTDIGGHRLPCFEPAP